MGCQGSKSKPNHPVRASLQDAPNPSGLSREGSELRREIQVPLAGLSPDQPFLLPLSDDGLLPIPQESPPLDSSELDIALRRVHQGISPRDIDPLRPRAADLDFSRPDFKIRDEVDERKETSEKENFIREIAGRLYLESKILFGGSERLSEQGLEVALWEEITKIVRDLLDHPQQRNLSNKDQESRTFIFEKGREIIKDNCFEIEIKLGVVRRDASNLIPTGGRPPRDDPPHEPLFNLVVPVSVPVEQSDESSDSEAFPPNEPPSQRRFHER